METSLSQQKLKDFIALHQKKNRVEQGVYIAEGWKAVSDLCAHGAEIVEFAVAKKMLEQCEAQTWAIDVPRWTMDEKQTERISMLQSPPGVFAVFKKPKVQPIQDMEPGWTLFLDGINDPGNVGTLLRTAHWFGISQIVLGAGTADAWGPKTVQASMGSLAAMRFYDFENTAALAAVNAPKYKLDLAGKSLYELREALQPGWIIAGSESHGPSAFWDTVPHETFVIPALSTNGPDSLNVGVSVGIALSYFCAPK